MVVLNEDPTSAMDDSSGNRFRAVEKTVEKLAPEDFLGASSSTSTQARDLLKSLYDLAKACENDGVSFDTFDNLILSQTPISKRQKKKGKNKRAFAVTEAPLSTLIVDDFDEDQIWEELQLQNGYIYDPLVSAVSKVLAQQHRPAKQNDGEESDDSAEELLKDLEAGGDFDEDEDELSDFFENEKTGKKASQKARVYSKSVVDDKFFSLAQMTEFIEQMDKEAEGTGRAADDDNEEEGEEEDELNMFEVGEEGETDADYYYKDFFDPPPNPAEKGSKTDAKSLLNKKSVTFADGGDSNDEDADDETEKPKENYNSTPILDKLPLDDSEESEVDESTLSTFEKKRRKIDKTIEEMEEEALKPKPWQLTGEVTAETRPENSLLEEHLIYDHLIKQAPEITLKTTQRLEDIIKQRVKDKAWDDVIRKIKPVEDPHEFKKRLVLDAEKSKLSLAEIYEKEYVDKTSKAEGVVAEEKEPEEHIKIKKDMKKLFHKLDALSNFTYTPAPPTVEIKVISNIPAISREEVGQSVLSDANLLAPQEILEPAKGEMKSQAERSKTDMKRERRLKKKKQHLKRLAEEEKARAKGLGLTSIKLAENVVKKARKDGKDEKVPQSKEFKSSKAFFAKLQDQVTNHIDKVAKRKQDTAKSKSISAKRFKL